MILQRAVLGVGVLLLGGCAYHNVVYNAERLYEEAETHRRAGRTGLSTARYQDVARKTGQALRARPASDWRFEALFLLGRAHVRLGDPGAAGAALREVALGASDETMRGGALVYLAVVHDELGEPTKALEAVDRALDGPLSAEVRAEAHLVRGRALLKGSQADEGSWELYRAPTVDPRLRVEAGLERLRWSIVRGDREGSRYAMEGLLAYAEAGARADTIEALVLTARDRWGAGAAAELLSTVEAAHWERAVRGRLALRRARLLHEAGGVGLATEAATRVAAGVGDAAAEARLQLATWRLERARDLADVYAVRGLLLPAGSDPRVAAALAALDELESYVSRGLDDPLGWFAAAEIARDRLGAGYVARGLFLAYADGAPAQPWAPKALLAALEISPEEADRAWLRARLETRRDNPYVLAAHGGSAAGFEALEEELDVRLRELSGR